MGRAKITPSVIVAQFLHGIRLVRPFFGGKNFQPVRKFPTRTDQADDEPFPDTTPLCVSLASFLSLSVF